MTGPRQASQALGRPKALLIALAGALLAGGLAAKAGAVFEPVFSK